MDKQVPFEIIKGVEDFDHFLLEENIIRIEMSRVGFQSGTSLPKDVALLNNKLDQLGKEIKDTTGLINTVAEKTLVMKEWCHNKDRFPPIVHDFWNTAEDLACKLDAAYHIFNRFIKRTMTVNVIEALRGNHVYLINVAAKLRQVPSVMNSERSSYSTSKKNQSKYPRSIFLIIATEFCERFSFCGLRTKVWDNGVQELFHKHVGSTQQKNIVVYFKKKFQEITVRHSLEGGKFDWGHKHKVEWNTRIRKFNPPTVLTILSLYLRNVLLYSENVATVIYHVFIMTCYCIPIFGAILADSFLGRFRTIVYFSFVYAFGNVMLSIGAAPIVHLPAIDTMLGLSLIAIGTGGIKPCVAAFGGDQFKMPEQHDLLQQFFSIFYFTINFGGFMGMMVTPILRKTIHCFGSDSCYALGFGFPAALMIIALVLFIGGKPWYKIKSPKENIIVQFTKCAGYALIEKMNSKKKVKSHWLDYASDKYDPKLIQDMKTVLAILFLYIPLPLFWSLFDQQGSSWTFQASRTNNELLGIHMIPDQMQVINPAIVLLLIPLFDKSIYPCLDKMCVLRCPLQRMVAGGFIAASAFVASGILELKLEETYPVLPGRLQAHINCVNLLPCNVQLVNPFNEIQVLLPGQNYIFRNITADNATRYSLDVIAPYACGQIYLTSPWKNIDIVPKEYQVEPLLITSLHNEVSVVRIAPEQLQKTLSGRPKLRTVILSEAKWGNMLTVHLMDAGSYHKIFQNTECPVLLTPYFELETGNYRFEVRLNNGTILHKGQIELNLGGVYSLIIKEEASKIDFAQMFVMTPPNSVHMLWLVPQYLLISVGEVMFAIAGLQFSFTQAPKSMKTVTIAAWYLSVAMGNLLVIIITQLNLFQSQAYEFFLYAILVFMDMMVFLIMTTKYKFVGIEADESTSLFTPEEPYRESVLGGDPPIALTPRDRDI